MSHLLYLHSFTVERFVSVFGKGSAAHLEKLLARATSPDARAIITKAVKEGLDGKPLPAASQALLDAAVYEALSTTSYGIGAQPISPNGCGGAMFDDYAAEFEEAGATKLFEVLQRGRNYESTFVLLSPDDVVLAARQLRAVVEATDDEDIDSELRAPLAKAAKKGLAVYGRWG